MMLLMPIIDTVKTRDKGFHGTKFNYLTRSKPVIAAQLKQLAWG